MEEVASYSFFVIRIYFTRLGPEIEFITEPWIKDNVGASVDLITEINEPRISKSYCVNMNLKKLYYIKTGDKDPNPTPCYVSLTVNAKAFFETVCRKMFCPLYKCKVHLLQGPCDYITLKDYHTKTLAELGIQENSVLEFSFGKDSEAYMKSESVKRDKPAKDTSNDMIIEEIGYEMVDLNHVAIPLTSKL